MHWTLDFRQAAQGLRRAKGFTASAVLTLALGVAATTTMFALVEGVVLRPLPVPEQDRLVLAWKLLGGDELTLVRGSASHWPFRAAEVDLIGRESRTLESVAGVSYYEHPSPFAILEDGRASSFLGASVTGNFFRVLEAEPILGRVLNRADDVAGAENVLVITHRLWQADTAGLTT